MKKTVKRFITSVLAVVMLLNAVPLSKFVGLHIDWLDLSIKSTALSESGRCGENVYWTFDNRTGLLTISGEGAMTNSPFKNDTAIKSVVIEDNVTTIVGNAFENCSSLMNVKFGKNVKTIGYRAFKDCSNLKKISLNDGLLKIYAEAFSGCTGLLNATLGSNLETIGNRAFFDCIKLLKITIPNSVTEIGDHAFENCIMLVCITIPDGIERIGNDAFKDIINVSYNGTVTGAPWGAKHLNLYCSDGLYYSDPSKTKLISCDKDKSGELYIPYGITDIEETSFIGCFSLSSIIVPSSVTNIGKYAFGDCSGLENITFLSDDMFIGVGAFANCNNLSKVNITNITSWCNISFESEESNPLINGGSLYVNNIIVKDLIIPNGVTSIGDYSFVGCSSLINVSISDKVLGIGKGAFAFCKALTGITISEGVRSIGERAFYNCAAIKNITIPDSVRTIGSCAFYGCKSLAEIDMGICISEIGERAFEECVCLKKVNITDVIAWCKISFTSYSSNPLYYSHKLYLNNELLTELIIPETVTSISNFAFNYCVNLNYLSLPDSVTRIGEESFYACAIKDIYIPQNVDYIGANAFACYDYKNPNANDPYNVDIANSVYNSSIEFITVDENNATFDSRENCNAIVKTENNEIILGCKNTMVPDSISLIGAYSFSSCKDIDNIIIPSSVQYIGERAFDGCSNLTKIYYSSEEDSWNCIEKGQEAIPLTAEIIFGFQSAHCHNFAWKKIISATCERWGATIMQCECGATYQNVVKAKGHCFSGWTVSKPATCTENGIISNCCTRCGVIRTEELNMIPHSYKIILVAPTCTEQGYTLHTCSVCNDSFVDTYTEPLNHPNKSWHIVKNPTLISEGLMEETCDLCNAKFNEMVIPMLVPDYVTGISLSHDKLALNIGETATITAKVNPDTAKNKNIIWSSTDADVASVDNGVITAKSPGMTVISAETEDNGFVKFCVVRVASLIAVNGSVVDNEKGIIYGIGSNSSDINSYVRLVDSTMIVQCESTYLGTGSTVNVLKSGKTVDSFKVIVFGDVNGDSWYDGTDAVLVNMIANGMLTREQIGEAVWLAADCNHDGVINQADVDLLNKAGLLLSSVDQTKSSKELFETSSEYVEYLGLIDQNKDVKSTPEQDNSEAQKTNMLEAIIAFIWALIKRIVMVFK